MTAIKKVELADIERLEKQNRDLKRKVCQWNEREGRQVLLQVREIGLRKENECLAAIVETIEGR